MNLALSAVGIGIQSAKGTAAAEPAFYHGVDGGNIVTFGVSQVEDELTSGLVAGTGEYRESVAVAADYGTRAWMKSVGAYLYAALGAVSVTGTTTYTHVITADSSLPYVTVFGKKDADFKVASDCKIDQLVLEWDGNGPLKLTPTFAGCALAYDTAYTPTLDETLLAYYTALGGTFTLDLNGSAEDCGATILGGKVTIARNLTSDMVSGTLAPSDVTAGKLQVDVELKGRVPDLTATRLLLTGTTTGTEASGAVLYGGFSFGFAGASPNTLAIAGTRVAWQTEDPGADPKGGPGELTLKGRCYMTAGGTPVTATVVNQHATYVVS